MGAKMQTRTTQTPLYAEFSWSTDDDMVATTAVSKTFVDQVAFDVIKLPPDAIILGGEVRVDQLPGYIAYEAGDPPAPLFDVNNIDPMIYKVKIGDEKDDDRYLAETELVANGTQQLTSTGYLNVGAVPVRVTVTDFTYAAADNDAGGAKPFTPGTTGEISPGKFTLRIRYVIDGRTTEVS